MMVPTASYMLLATDFSIEGLQFIILTSAMLAFVTTWMQYDNSDFVEWISEKAFPDDKEDGKVQDLRPSVRNPITGRMIKEGGSTYRDLRKKGIMFEEEAMMQPASKLEYRMVRKGFGVRPLEGSIAVVHYTLRTGGAIGKGGDLIYSTLSAVGANDLPSPFVFEVGDPGVLRGLNQAVLGMVEQEEGIVVVPPTLGYTAQRKHPILPTKAAREALNSFLRREGGEKPLVFDLALERVLELPPMMILKRGDAVSPDKLSEMLEVSPDGSYKLNC